MRNQTTSPIAPQNHTQDHDADRTRVRRVRRNRKAILASGAVVAVGALVGSGFALQTAVADEHRRPRSPTPTTAASSSSTPTAASSRRRP
jgi:hypothetical protein